MSSKFEMEKKLLEYRSKKEREEALTKNTKSKFKSLFSLNTMKKDDDATQKLLPSSEIDIIHDDEQDLLHSPEEFETDADDASLNCCTYVDLIYYTLCFILWASLYAVFIKLEFGTIYFIVTALIGMYLNTRTGRKNRNEVSAYSVFNRNCESIDGTLKAEQLERQMIYGRLT